MAPFSSKSTLTTSDHLTRKLSNYVTRLHISRFSKTCGTSHVKYVINLAKSSVLLLLLNHLSVKICLSRLFNPMPSPILSVAPMIQWTDVHWRYMFRGISAKTTVYTEMTMSSALVHHAEELHKFLGKAVEHPCSPCVVQLGGMDPAELGEAAYLCESYSAFEAINLNCGCPSGKAKKFGFGAEMMLNPDLTRRCVYEMKRRVSSSDVTVKCRLGIYEEEFVDGANTDYNHLVKFIGAVAEAGCSSMIVHARDCVLRGLSPAQNRSVPPLRPDVVHALAADFPEMNFHLNGGIRSFEDIDRHLSRSDGEGPIYPLAGVMVGRKAYDDPFMFSTADSRYYDHPDSSATRAGLLERYFDYVEDYVDGINYFNLSKLIQPCRNFFSGKVCYGDRENKLYKQKLDSLIKEHAKHAKCKGNGDEEGAIVREIVLEAIRDTIPDSFLHETI